jgi:hypothetical protein
MSEGIVRGDVVIIRPNDRLTVGAEADFRGAVRRCSTAGRRACAVLLNLNLSLNSCRGRCSATSIPLGANDVRAKRILGFTSRSPSCIVKFASWRFRTQVNASWCEMTPLCGTRDVRLQRSVEVLAEPCGSGPFPMECPRQEGTTQLTSSSTELFWYRYGDSNPGPVAENHVS